MFQCTYSILILLVESFLLSREVLSAAKRPVHYQALFSTSPLVVMNGFGNSKKRHLELLQTIVENMFPSINVDTVSCFKTVVVFLHYQIKLNSIKRAVLFSYDPETERIEFRH